MNETAQLEAAKMQERSARSKAGLAGLGAALAAMPFAAYGGYRLYKHLDHSTAKGGKALEQAYAYDLSALKTVDASLIQYREERRIETGMQSPRAITMDGEGNLLVAGDRVVRRFSASGGFSDVATLSQAPFCMAVGPDGSIYVGMKDHVEVFSADGKPKATWDSLGARAYLTSIAVAGDSVWLADAGRRLVVRCGLDGKVAQEIGKPSAGHPGLVVPSAHLDVAVARDGNVWITNPGMLRLEAYSADGQFQRTWGTAGTKISEFFGCCNPTDFALLSDGSFVTAEKGIARIKRYHPDGRFDCVVAPPSSFGEDISGIDLAAHPNGKIFALEKGSRSVRVFVHEGGPA